MIINNILICKYSDLPLLSSLLMLPSLASLALLSSLSRLPSIFYPHLPFKHQWFSTRNGDCREGSHRNQQGRNSISAYVLPFPEIHTHLPTSPLPSGLFHALLVCKHVVRKSPIGDSNKFSLRIILCVTTLLWQ